MATIVYTIGQAPVRGAIAHPARAVYALGGMPVCPCPLKLQVGLGEGRRHRATPLNNYIYV